MFKFYEGLSPPLMDSVFKLKTENPFNIRKVFEFSRPIVNTVYQVTECI